MPPKQTNARRFDPYKNFKFRVRIDGKIVAAVSKVSGIQAATRAITAKTGINKLRAIPSQTKKFEPITLERGVTHDAEFEKWAFNFQRPAKSARSSSSLKNLRKDIIIEVYNETGELTRAFKLKRCWLSKIQSADLDAKGNEVAIESIQLEHEGIEII